MPALAGPTARGRKSPTITASPVAGLRLNAVPAPDAPVASPWTMAWTSTGRGDPARPEIGATGRGGAATPATISDSWRRGSSGNGAPERAAMASRLRVRARRTAGADAPGSGTARSAAATPRTVVANTRTSCS